MNRLSVETPWWREAVGYSLYLRSFADSNGDGIGDLAGVIQHLDHLAYLGINLVWITPFYPSPMADFGYDVADYCGVNPGYGDLGVVDELLGSAHRRGIRVIFDLVPNHSSIDHPWFRAARKDRSSPKREYYIWADPAANGGPPNNWVSYFGGPAWTLEPETNQYYLHLFLPDQPDLNWRNRAVRDEFDRILRFWLDRGVDGFRVDVAQGLIKDRQLRSNPVRARWDPRSDRLEQWEAFDHAYDILQPESRQLFTAWKEICAAYDAVLIGETSVSRPEDLAPLLRGDGFDVGFWLEPLHRRWDAKAIRSAIQDPLEEVADQRSIGWQSSSLDEMRAASRFGGGSIGQERALGLAVLLFCLPGLPFLYQGEELGLVDGVVLSNQRADPVGADVSLSRDGCRTPMPWKPGPAFGFSTSAETWLPDGGRSDRDTAFAQRGLEGSWLERYRALVRLRLDHLELRSPTMEWLESLPLDVVGFRRGVILVVLNMSEQVQPVELGGSVLYNTHDGIDRADGMMMLRPAQAVVVQCTDVRI